MLPAFLPAALAVLAEHSSAELCVFREDYSIIPSSRPHTNKSALKHYLQALTNESCN